MRVAQSDGESPYPDAMPNGRWRISNDGGETVGAVSFGEYDPQTPQNERDIYASISELFDVEAIASLVRIEEKF